jgi:hypothetical protein
MKNHHNNPVIIGITQHIPLKSVSKPLDPLRIMQKTSSLALWDTQAKDIEKHIDSIYKHNKILLDL